MRRYAETFFRYWMLILVPIIVLPVADFALMRHVPKTVVVTADLWVNQAPPGYNSQFTGAAGNEASYINEYLQSPSDIAPIIGGSTAFAQLERTAPADALKVEQTLLESFQVNPKGQYLLGVSFTGQDEGIARDAVNGLIAAIQAQQQAQNSSQTQTNIAVTEAQVNTDYKNQAQSKKVLQDYMARKGLQASDLANPNPLDTNLAGYEQQFQNDQKQYLNDQQALSKLRAQAALPASEQQAPFYTKDPAAAIVTSSRKKILLSMLEALAVALFLSGSFLVAKTLLDRGLRYPDEVADVLDLPVLAVVPFAPPAGSRGGGRQLAAGQPAVRGRLADV